MAEVLLTKGGAKRADNNEAVTSLQDALDIQAKCCGIRCCPGQEALRLTDRTNNVTHELYFDNNGFFVRIFNADGTILSTTQLV